MNFHRKNTIPYPLEFKNEFLYRGDSKPTTVKTLPSNFFFESSLTLIFCGQHHLKQVSDI